MQPIVGSARRVLRVAAVFAALSVPASAQDWPDASEAKAIAEEAYIYGLPIVMNYSVMNDYAVDRDSGQFKAPFNQISNEARVYTYEDTTIVSPNSDTPYSVAWLDLRVEPVVLSVPAVEDGRYYSAQLTDTSAPARRAATPATIWSSVRAGAVRHQTA